MRNGHKPSSGQLHGTDKFVGLDLMDTHTYDDSGMGHANACRNGAGSKSTGRSAA
jgi:hypothetical protein